MAYTTLSVAYIDGDVFSAGDINNTNTVANALSNGTNQALITTQGDILTGGATANALVKTAVGSNNTVFYANSAASGGVSWGLITSAMITDATITGTDIASGTITSTNILDATITGTDIASGTITSTNIANDTIVNADINSAAGIVDTKLATISTAGKVSNSATTATASDTASAIVARDGSNSFYARTGYFEGGYLGGLDYTNAVSAGNSGSLTTNGDGVIRVGKFSANVTGITINQQGGSSPGYHISFYRSGTNVGSISENGSTTSYNTTSDYRLKENVKDLQGALATIEALQPKTYNFIATPEITQDGFFAHELQSVVPYAVIGEKDALDQDGNIQPQQVDYSKLTGLLVGAVQELSARVKELEKN
jgi:hypothetical protein